MYSILYIDVKEIYIAHVKINALLHMDPQRQLQNGFQFITQNQFSLSLLYTRFRKT